MWVKHWLKRLPEYDVALDVGLVFLEVLWFLRMALNPGPMQLSI